MPDRKIQKSTFLSVQGDLLTTMTGNQTAESCCAACWLYNNPSSRLVECDVWVLDTSSGSCELRNNTAAASLQEIDVIRDSSTVNLISGIQSASYFAIAPCLVRRDVGPKAPSSPEYDPPLWRVSSLR